MDQQTLVAYFDQRLEAERAAKALVDAGVHPDAIRLRAGEETAAGNGQHEDKGFWNSVADFFMPNEDRDAYEEGVRRGGAAVIVSQPGENIDDVADILDRHGAVDIDEREAQWKGEGWTGGTARAPSGDASSRGEEVIPVGEEHLRVGKREVNKGRVRVRSYVVETPVEERVALRNEEVSVNSRSVDRAAEAGDEGLFRDRTIEAEEVDEHAVVAKEARVTGEVSVDKKVGEHTETIKDSVRHTEVKVDDDRNKSR